MESASASGKIGAFVGTYALTSLLPRIGLADMSAIVGFVAVLGAVVTVTTLLEPKGQSLDELTEEGERAPTSGLRSRTGRESGHTSAAGAGARLQPSSFIRRTALEIMRE